MVFPWLRQYIRTPAPASPIRFSLAKSGPISDSLWWIFMSPRFKPLSEFVSVHSITPRTFSQAQTAFSYEWKEKKSGRLKLGPVLSLRTQKEENNKSAEETGGNRQKRWQWPRFQKVLIALPQEKPFSWSLDPRVNKCLRPPCLTDTIPCTVYILQVTRSTTAIAQPHRFPDLWVIRM